MFPHFFLTPGHRPRISPPFLPPPPSSLPFPLLGSVVVWVGSRPPSSPLLPSCLPTKGSSAHPPTYNPYYTWKASERKRVGVDRESLDRVLWGIQNLTFRPPFGLHLGFLFAPLGLFWTPGGPQVPSWVPLGPPGVPQGPFGDPLGLF